MKLAAALLLASARLAAADGRADVEVFASANATARSGDTLAEYRLDRGELGGTGDLGTWAGAELRVESVRSASDGGTLGIDGDSLVLRVKRARVFVHGEQGAVRGGVELGAIADPWIAWLERGYTVRPLSPTASERLLGWQVSDLAIGAWGSWDRVRVAVSSGNGEGLSFPERNTGKTTTGVAEVAIVDGLVVAGMVRDGSVGPASVRDRRVGGGIAATFPQVRGGLEIVRAYGVGDRGDVDATALAGWAEGKLADRVFVAVRGQTARFSTDGNASTFGGGVSYAVDRDHARIWLAFDRATTDGTAQPLAGADAGASTTFQLIFSADAPIWEK